MVRNPRELYVVMDFFFIISNFCCSGNYYFAVPFLVSSSCDGFKVISNVIHSLLWSGLLSHTLLVLFVIIYISFL